MARALAETRARFGALHGVVHAAGLAGRGILQRKTAELCEAVLRPKLEGTMTLHGLLDGAQLDFLALFSSVNTAFGWLGTADYSSANAFLDAYAQAGIGHVARRVVAINWAGWREVGMAAAAMAGSVVAIAPEQGVQAFYRALASEATRLLARVQDTFHVRLPMRAVFEASTIRGLLEAIRDRQPAVRPARIGAVEEEREEIEL
jgi:hypothetical protein